MVVDLEHLKGWPLISADDYLPILFIPTSMANNRINSTTKVTQRRCCDRSGFKPVVAESKAHTIPLSFDGHTLNRKS